MTPSPIAAFMASMFKPNTNHVRLLDAGAGVGSLTAAYVAAACGWRRQPASIDATCYEVDPTMLLHLHRTVDACTRECDAVGIRFTGRIIERDFIEEGARQLDRGLFGGSGQPRFSAAILNPPYRKINSGSRERGLLRSVGIETSNLYTAFVGLAVKLMDTGGELVAITPRSFCNGPYFRPFRQLLLGQTALTQVHVFESRDRAFSDNEVLQENVIFCAVRGAKRSKITLSSSSGPNAKVTKRVVAQESVVSADDPESFIHLAVTEADGRVADQMRRLPCSLTDLGLEVSTGRVVDFRAREHLRADPSPGTVPLIYPTHFNSGFVAWPRPGGRKPNALVSNARTLDLLVQNATYVLTKRFTSKEERRRVVAVIHDPARLPKDVTHLGIENHVNYYHAMGAGMPKLLAHGLAAFLNSTLVDQFFRQFNGHTQVNAGDLRSLRYPSRDVLNAVGRRIGKRVPDQADLDAVVAAALS